jgi:cytochrome c-type biogenesis protein CcmH/NrfG
VYVAIGFSLLVRNAESRIERRKMSLQAEKHLKQAEDLDPFDYLVKYYLALHYAMARQVRILSELWSGLKSILSRKLW